MLFAFFIFVVALSISAIAAWYSIVGLTAIFAAAAMPIIIMGSALEIGKISATIWLHRYWKQAAWQFKLYLIPAIAVLMFVTSMGIFGFLSKAHIEQTASAGNNGLEIELLDNQIAREYKRIDDTDLVISQLDQSVQTLMDYDRIRGKDGAIAVREQQKSERDNLNAIIEQSQQKISELQDRRMVLDKEQVALEAEVGPLKYIAALIYGDNPDKSLLEQSVRYVIVLLVLVFDPLALVLLLAADQTYFWAKARRKQQQLKKHTVSEMDSLRKKHEELLALIDRLEKAKEQINQKLSAEIETVNRDNVQLHTAHLHELQRADTLSTQLGQAKQDLEKLQQPDTNSAESLPDHDAQASNNIELPAKSEPQPAKVTAPAETNDAHAVLKQQLHLNTKTPSLQVTDSKLVVLNPTSAVRPDFRAQPDNVGTTVTSKTNADFGGKFPEDPSKGDLFMRVDVLPARLFKYNGNKWIEVSRTSTDRFIYNTKYIEHLIAKIEAGEYNIDLLTPSEQDQIIRYLDELPRS